MNQYRQNLMPYLVSCIIHTQIGTVCKILYAFLLQIILNFFSLHAKKRPDNPLPHRSYPAQAPNPTASGQMIKKGLSHIVLMMCQSHLISIPLLHKSLKRIIAGLSPCFLQGHMPFLCHLLHRIRVLSAGNLPLPAEPVYIIRISSCLFSANLVIHMDHAKREVCLFLIFF